MAPALRRHWQKAAPAANSRTPAAEGWARGQSGARPTGPAWVFTPLSVSPSVTCPIPCLTTGYSAQWTCFILNIYISKALRNQDTFFLFFPVRRVMWGSWWQMMRGKRKWSASYLIFLDRTSEHLYRTHFFRMDFEEEVWCVKYLPWRKARVVYERPLDDRNFVLPHEVTL